MSFHEKLQALRLRHGLSQEELAARLNLARQTIGKWEAGRSTPDLPHLITLSDLFSVPVDQLIRDHDCSCSILSTPAPIADLSAFLLQAKRSTYAAHAAEAGSCRPSSHDYLFEQGEWRYLDSYLGGRSFSGEEIVWHQDVPIWSMNYCGRVLREPFSGDFLKEALLHGTPELPYRGPQLYKKGDWAYCSHTDGSLDWFSGYEQIFYSDQLVYECRFHGGRLE